MLMETFSCEGQALRVIDVNGAVKVVSCVKKENNILKSQFQNSPVPSFKRMAWGGFMSSNLW